MAMSGSLSIVDTAPAIQQPIGNLNRLLSPLLQMEFRVGIQSLWILGQSFFCSYVTVELRGEIPKTGTLLLYN